MPTISSPVVSEVEKAQRERALEGTVATLRLEGQYLDPEARAIFKRHAAGEIDWDEFRAAIEEFSVRRFGPLPLPRDSRP